jgi:hypothetical protein
MNFERCPEMLVLEIVEDLDCGCGEGVSGGGGGVDESS